MALLAKHRRAWIAVFVGVLWLPILGQLAFPTQSMSENEARMLRTFPEFPKSTSELAAYPAALQAYVADHVGFRDSLIEANAMLRYALSSPSNWQVLLGRDGFLFLLNYETLEKSLGLVIDEELVERLADAVAQLHRELAQRNIRFLFASPPSNSTINRRRLPAWAAAPPRETEHDLILRLLAARGVPTLDLRIALQAENSQRETYFQTDTHWNFLGAVIARNEMVRAVGHPEWALDVTRVFRGYRVLYGRGDLARTLGAPSIIPERQDAIVDVSSYRTADGPPVVLIGDSFVTKFFPSIWRNGGKPIFIEDVGCRPDLDAILAHRPTVVIWSITERALALLC